MPQLPPVKAKTTTTSSKKLGYTTDQIQALITTDALIEPGRQLVAETDA